MASNYNSRYRPAEVLWLNGKAHLIRERETFEDLLRGQVELPELFEEPAAVPERNGKHSAIVPKGILK